MKLRCFAFIVIVIFAIIPATVFTQTAAKKPEVNAVKINTPFQLTGKLDNPAWMLSQPVELLYEITPGENTPAPQKTLVYTLYDEKNIYFGFRCYDTNPELIRANITDRDNMFQDDFVFVAIDTYGDYQRYYELAVNPFGIKGDIMAVSNSVDRMGHSNNEDVSFDMIWDAKAERNENGWTAEMAIPFSSINFPNTEEQTWVLAFQRTIPRASRIQVSWTINNRSIPGLITQAGLLKGLKNIKSGGSIELLPYAMMQKSGYMSDLNNPVSGIKYDPVIGRIGGSIKYSPSTSFTLETVFNPDFSQIESDAAQISVNTTFALNYEEKRPFFLTGRELLPGMYYSRSINDPLYAGRIMGKAGSLTYLYMGAYDRNTVFVIPGEDQSSTVPTNLNSFVNIGRARYDFGDEDYIGGMVSTRNMDGGHNYLVGVDWRFKFWGNWYVNGNSYLSQTNELNNTELFNSERMFGTSGYTAGFNGEKYSGTGLDVGLSYNGRSYNFSLGYSQYSPTFQTYNGLFTSTGNRAISMHNSFIFYPQNSFFDKITISIPAALRFNFEGLKKEQFSSPSIEFQLKGQTEVSLSYLLVNDENFFGKDLKSVNRFNFEVSTRPVSGLYFSFEGDVGNFILRSRNSTIGSGHNFNVTLQVKPTSQIDITLSYIRSKLRSNYTDELFFDGNIYRGVAIYQFNSEILFRTILQYDTFDKSFQIYPLFSYKLNAFTTCFAGITSNYTDYQGEFGFKNTDQQYFIKVQYLLGI
jgi:hypothetical protein